MATSKALRAAPERLLNNYVASIKKIFGEPESVPDEAFLRGKFLFNGRLDSAGAWPVAQNSEAASVTEPIGFSVTINNTTYTQFSVAMAGWVFLRDPAGGSTNPDVFYQDIIDSVALDTQDIYKNVGIKDTFSNNHLFLPVWFDKNITVASTSGSLSNDTSGYSTKMTTAIGSNIAAGLDTRYWPYNSIDYGIRYVNSYDSKRGKSLLVRWTVTQQYYGDRLKFELALFENGTIEYRYWPLKTFETGDTAAAASTATCGIFWNGFGSGGKKFRDLAPLLDYQRENRKLSMLGGASYDSTYSDSGVSYSVGLNRNNWPKNGAIITFSPPIKPSKILPRKIISDMASTKRLVRSPGLYDDRKTINYTNGIAVEMPSTLPNRLIGDSGDVNVALRQSLFVSGSASGSLLITSGRASKSAINMQLAQLDAIESMNKSVDRSFNESQKNYVATYSTSSFYATGSAIENFGAGFSSPLKSKTQFRLSLPVRNPTTMPPSTSSFYYYDNSLERWMGVSSNTNPGAIYSENEDSLSAYEVQLDASPIYRVVETAIGFDAVGRKVVSGSDAGAYGVFVSGINQQTDKAIGAIANNDGASLSSTVGAMYSSLFSNESKESYFRSFAKSVSNSTELAPSPSKKINLPIDYPFLIEKVVVNLPLYISGGWFNDVTTCMRPFVDSSAPSGMVGRFRGAIDFGGPGITFGLHCHRRCLNSSYMDLIASGTITHMNDNMSSVVLKKDPIMKHYSLRPTGFKSFSNPTCVVSGTSNIFNGNVNLELTPSIAGGLTFARLDRSYVTSSAATPGSISATLVSANRTRALELLTTSTLITKGERPINNYDARASNTYANAFSPALSRAALEALYPNRSPRIYIQQISPLSRGSTGVQFSGNSILGSNIASFNLENKVINPLYVSSLAALPSSYSTILSTSDFGFEAVSIYSTVDVQDSPYLVLPGDTLTLSLSKTRPAVYKAVNSPGASSFYTFELTGSHGTVQLATGSIDITIYGSYVREGVEFNP